MPHNQKTVTTIARDMLGMMDHRAFPVYTVTYEQHVTLFQARVSLLLAWDKSGGDPTVCNDGTMVSSVTACHHNHAFGLCKIQAIDLNDLFDDLIPAPVLCPVVASTPCVFPPEPDPDNYDDHGCP